jgi:hypothetical protein
VVGDELAMRIRGAVFAAFIALCLLVVYCEGLNLALGLGELNHVLRQVADRFENCASGLQLGFELGFTDPSEPESITKKVLGLIVGGDYDFQKIVFHGRVFRLVLALRRATDEKLRDALEIIKQIFIYFSIIFVFPYSTRVSDHHFLPIESSIGTQLTGKISTD